jgi:hypothetical protein
LFLPIRAHGVPSFLIKSLLAPLITISSKFLTVRSDST